MKILLLGIGKTGSLVREVATERGHAVDVLLESENDRARGLTKERLSGMDVVIDFTTPHCVLDNIAACIERGKNMVVGTTGWYQQIPPIKTQVEKCGTGFIFGSNFSVGVNMFFELVKTAAPALKQNYVAHIYERHHVHKKDAPSGTAATMQQILENESRAEVEITSFREGEVVGMHELTLESAADTIYLCHDAKSRRGFAEGAVRAAEWLQGKKGFYEFKDIWRQV
ncbi:MAG TPA: dihydrodipicolinate reductase C-terminal domain-containing protein [Terriglobales bacterium]|jgi:4-hydroxy-tetrahydrodipicolinate reductase|nr:dihydrodipicolinate reductase C-terminal domain-containing protein [Terriglobales bacterium]